METDDKVALPDNALTTWRKSYLRLRLLERQLVSITRGTEDPAEIESLYREIEALRQDTTEMFTVAQIESVSRHVKLFRPGPAAPHQPNFSFTTVAPSVAGPAPVVPAVRRQPEIRTARQPSPVAAGSRPLALSSRSLRAPSPP